MGWIILGIIAFAIESIRRDHDNLWLWLFIIGVIMLIINPLFTVLLFIALAILVGIAILLLHLIVGCITGPPHPFQGVKRRIKSVSPISFIAFLVLVCLAVLAIVLIADLLDKESCYNRAVSLMEEGEYNEAKELFWDLTYEYDADYKDFLYSE